MTWNAEGIKSIKRDRGTSLAEFFNYVVLIVGMLVMTVVLALLVRVQRGLLGIVLAAAAVALLAYWINELRKTVKKELSVPSAMKWSPDILHQGNETIVVGTVPGPEEKVKAEFRNGILEVRGGQRFFEFVTLGKDLKIEETKYVNRVLQVRLRKESVPSVKEQ
ncbi:MAG: hypothetical protein OEZ24_04190 [Candidatus Bathyarchaeota archaeon]|nr:hypothetical protein [Candidatus Bathyarchaeota archaeon]